MAKVNNYLEKILISFPFFVIYISLTVGGCGTDEVKADIGMVKSKLTDNSDVSDSTDKTAKKKTLEPHDISMIRG